MSLIFRFLVLGIVLAGIVDANDLPNVCSRDHNPNEFTILSYHEIADNSETLDPNYAVTPEHFEEQIRWLSQSGYHFIGVGDIINYRKDKKALPKKAVLITFDDGYKSVYVNAFPIIQKYKIPVVIALVGSWLSAKESVDFDGNIIARSKFLNQHEIKTMIGSGLVEIASHSYDLHRGILGNPQGNMQSAVVTRQWLGAQKHYENEQDYQQRIFKDLAKNSTFLQDYTGQKPRVIVWPYGRYNKTVRTIAQQLGMPIGLTLDDGSNTKTTPLWGMRRILVENTMTLKDLELNMWLRNANLTDDDRTTKAAHIDLDYIYDVNPEQQERNLGDLLDRIKTLGINTVYLQAFADPDANGAADYVYFPNRNIPMRADLFNRVAWQIATRTQVKRIYAWMPMLAWQLPKGHEAAKDTVVTIKGNNQHLNMGYPRLSPFSLKSQKVLREIYEDLAKSPRIDGLLFHDDVTLTDYEDNSKFARKQYQKWGLPASVTNIKANRTAYEKWSMLKIDYLDDLALQLAGIVRDGHPGLKTARNLYAEVASNWFAQEWYGQGLTQSFKKYDYTAIMAMPYMEKSDDNAVFYRTIVDNIKQEECGLERTVMELQTVDWRKDGEAISSQELGDTIKMLYDMGVHHIAYYPDNVFKNIPDADTVNNAFKQKSVRMRNIVLAPRESK
jgi:poly-beta-1,6-N-acetyl-D-glucosamine N-deacetylase